MLEDYKEFNNFFNKKDKSNQERGKNLLNLKISDEGRQSDSYFRAIGYPSKVYYENIREYIKEFSDEGDVVLDSCCGSGSTGVASLIEKRKVVILDSSPTAVFMTYNSIHNHNFKLIKKEYELLKSELMEIINDIYSVKYSENEMGYATTIICSNVYSCPKCEKEIILNNSETGERSEYSCKYCGEIINISTTSIKDRLIETRKEVEISIKSIDGKGKAITRIITDEDIKHLNERYNYYNEKYGELWAPEERIIYNRCYPRKGGWPGFPIDSTVQALFSPRNLLSLKILNNYIEEKVSEEVREFFKFIFLESLFRTSNRLFKESGIKTVYHIPPVGKVQNVFTVFERKYKSILKGLEELSNKYTGQDPKKMVRLFKGNARQLELPDNCIDYAFIDPPYGGIVPYAELNLFYSAWLNEKEDLENEIIIPMDFEKIEGFTEVWGQYIREAFSEVYRTLKIGAYFTIVFHSKFNDIWNVLNKIMIEDIGFEFFEIAQLDRGTTFHTNNLNDTNPKNAFITYRKTSEKSNVILKNDDEIFKVLNKEYLLNNFDNLRAIQTEIIKVCYRNKIKVPSDNKIKNWLEE